MPSEVSALKEEGPSSTSSEASALKEEECEASASKEEVFLEFRKSGESFF